MHRYKIKYLLLAALFLSVTVSCKPQVPSNDFEKVSLFDNTTLKDQVLDLESLKDISLEIQNKTPLSDTDTYFDLTINLFTLYDLTKNKTYLNTGRKLKNDFYNNSNNYSIFNFENSPYLSAFIGQSEEEAIKSITLLDKHLEKQLSKLKHILTEHLDENFPWPDSSNTLAETLKKFEYLITWFDLKMHNHRIDVNISESIINSIEQKTQSLMFAAKEQSEELYKEEQFSQIVIIVKQIISSANIVLNEEYTGILAQAEEIGASIDISHEGAGKALKTLILLWAQMDDTKRRATFKKVSPELYNYLSKTSDGGLECLQKTICFNPFLETAKRLFVMPELHDYGLTQLAVAVNISASDYVKNEVSQKAAAFFKEVPLLLYDQIEIEMTALRAEIALVKNDYSNYITNGARQWSKEGFNKELFPAIESIRKSTAPPSIDKSIVTTSSAVIGGSLALTAFDLKNETPKSNADIEVELFSQINKLLPMIGYKQADKTPYPSYSIFKSHNKITHSSLDALNESNVPFFMPDTFMVKSGFEIFKPALIIPTATVRSQAKLVKGVALFTQFLKDWENNIFNSTLETKTADMLLTKLPKESLNKSIFPKDISYTIALVNNLSIFKNLNKSGSPVFLINLDGDWHWSNKNSTLSHPAAMAGVVDIVNSERVLNVNTEDTSLFLLSLLEFLESIEGVENTTSFLLNPPTTKASGASLTTNQASALDEILSAKASLRALSIAMGNFLTNKLYLNGEGFYAGFNLETKQVLRAPVKTLQSQLLTMQALLRLSEYLNNDLYKKVAIENYYYLNHTFWSKSRNFYAPAIGETKNRPLNLSEATELLKTLYMLEPHLNSHSLTQLVALKQKLEMTVLGVIQ